MIHTMSLTLTSTFGLSIIAIIEKDPHFDSTMLNDRICTLLPVSRSSPQFTFHITHRELAMKNGELVIPPLSRKNTETLSLLYSDAQGPLRSWM